MNNKNVHTEHCCATCKRCKYGEDQLIEGPFDEEPFIPCPVVNGDKKQSFPHTETSVCYDCE